MSQATPTRFVAAAAADSAIVLSIRSETAQLTVLRRATSVFDYFELDEVRLFGEISISWWRELGCWAVVKGASQQPIVGATLTFVPQRVPNLKKALAECRKERPLDALKK